MNRYRYEVRDSVLFRIADNDHTPFMIAVFTMESDAERACKWFNAFEPDEDLAAKPVTPL